MSDDCRCDKCGATGRRRRFTFAPEGWFFIETLIDDEEPEQGTTIIRACSKECAMGMWENGPGDLNRSNPYPPESSPPPPRSWPDDLLTAFHQRWGSDKDSPTYDKREWQRLEAMIQSLLNTRNNTHNEPDQTQEECPTGSHRPETDHQGA